MKYKKTISLGLSNFYGEVISYETPGGKFYMQLDSWDGPDISEISEEFFRAIEKEFEGD